MRTILFTLFLFCGRHLVAQCYVRIVNKADSPIAIWVKRQDFVTVVPSHNTTYFFKFDSLRSREIEFLTVDGMNYNFCPDQGLGNPLQPAHYEMRLSFDRLNGYTSEIVKIIK